MEVVFAVYHRSEKIEDKTEILQWMREAAPDAISWCQSVLKVAQSHGVLQQASLCGKTFLLAAYNLTVVNSVSLSVREVFLMLIQLSSS